MAEKRPPRESVGPALSLLHDMPPAFARQKPARSQHPARLLWWGGAPLILACLLSTASTAAEAQPAARGDLRTVTAAGLVGEAAVALGRLEEKVTRLSAPLAGVGWGAGGHPPPPLAHALGGLRQAVDTMAPALASHDLRYFSALAAGSRSLVELRAAWRCGLRAEPARERELARLSHAFRLLRAHFGGEAVRARRGGQPTAAETARLQAVRRAAARGRAALAPLAARAGRTGDAVTQAELARLETLLARLAAVQAGLAAYLNSAILGDVASGEWSGAVPFIAGGQDPADSGSAGDASEGPLAGDVVTGMETGFVFAAELGGGDGGAAGATDGAGGGPPAGQDASVWRLVERPQTVSAAEDAAADADSAVDLGPFSAIPEDGPAAAPGRPEAVFAAGSGDPSLASGGAGDRSGGPPVASIGSGPEPGGSAEPADGPNSVPGEGEPPAGTLIVHGGGGGVEVVGEDGLKHALSSSGDGGDGADEGHPLFLVSGGSEPDSAIQDAAAPSGGAAAPSAENVENALGALAGVGLMDAGGVLPAREILKEVWGSEGPGASPRPENLGLNRSCSGPRLSPLHPPQFPACRCGP